MNVKPLFVDTSGWANFADNTERFHSLATAIYRDAVHNGREIITTNYVLAELIALLTSPMRFPRDKSSAFVQDIRTSPHVTVAHINAVADANAWQLLLNRLDKDWSLVDCASFELMQDRGIAEALTTDHHFEQAGFIRLLK